MQRRQKIQTILQAISKGIYEREEVINLSLLAAVAGESIFLLGPPGVAKSLVARRLKFAFKEGKSFEYLMSKFSTPDEIFGPVSIKKLKDEDRYERLTDKYLPGANIVFLDEIWKAGPAIQNALLTILNEKIYRNGEQEITVNIRGIISASNEVPTHTEGVEALWDRFLVRYYLAEIRQAKNFISMITATENLYEDNLNENDKITDAEFDAWSTEIDTIEVPAEVLNTIQLIKFKLDEYNQNQNQAENRIDVFDRRWKKIIRLLRTSAFLNERKQVDLMDCFLITHCLWSKPSQFDTLMQIVSETIRKHGYSLALNLNTIKQEIKEFEVEINAETKIRQQIFVDELMTVASEYLEVLNIKGYFDGHLIKKADFSKLSKEEHSSVSLFDANYSLTNRLNARLSILENTIEIFYNSQTISFGLRTKKAEKTETILKKPHPIIAKYWDERIETLEKYIKEQQAKIAQNQPEELDYLKNNLFVDARLSEIVEANMQEVIKSLQTLQLQVEKLAFYYRGL